jgi:hypothetical protein
MHTFTRDLAVARFAAVVAIELLALGVCFLPLLKCPQQWQKDCRKVGTVAGFLALLVCLIALVAVSLAPRAAYDGAVVRFLEWGIVGVYALNVTILVFVTARTGGPTSSLYGTLIPIQLSAMLFMQLEKDRLTGESSVRIAGLYVVFALVGYLLAHYLREPIARWRLLFVTDPAAVDYAKENATWAAWLTVGAMFLSFAAYAMPSDERFVKRVRSWYENAAVSAPTAEGARLGNR